jgi:hypothetical protein
LVFYGRKGGICYNPNISFDGVNVVLVLVGKIQEIGHSALGIVIDVGVFGVHPTGFSPSARL